MAKKKVEMEEIEEGTGVGADPVLPFASDPTIVPAASAVSPEPAPIVAPKRAAHGSMNPVDGRTGRPLP